MRRIIGTILNKSLIIAVGNFFAALSMAGIKLYLIRGPKIIYAQYSFIYANYQTFQLLGLFSINLVIMSLVTKLQRKDKKIAYLINSLMIVIVFSFLSIFFFIFYFAKYDYEIIILLFFSLAYLFDNINYVFIFFFLGCKKVSLGSLLMSLMGILKLSLTLIFGISSATSLYQLSLVFLISSIALTFIIFVYSIVTIIKQSNSSIKSIIKNFYTFYDFSTVKILFFNGFFVLIISVCYSGYVSLNYILTEQFIGIESLAYIDPAFMLVNFVKIALNAIIQAIIIYSGLLSPKKLLKSALLYFVIPVALLSAVYYLSYTSIGFYGLIFSFVFGFSDQMLEKSIAIMSLSLPFQIIYSIGLGYGQGKIRNKNLSLISVISLLIGVLITYFLLLFGTFYSSLWGYLFYSVILGLFHILFLLYGYNSKDEHFLVSNS